MDIREFIEQRLNEDAAIAAGVHGQGEWNENSAWLADMVHPLQSQRIERPDWIPMATVGDIRHIARHDPVRVRREVAAKRALLREIDSELADDPSMIEGMTGERLKILASIFDGHPDFDPAWRING